MKILSKTERIILLTIFAGVTNPAFMAEVTKTHRSSISRTLSKLNQAGLIRSRRDGVQKKYHLTEMGQKLLFLLLEYDKSMKNLEIEMQKNIRY